VIAGAHLIQIRRLAKQTLTGLRTHTTAPPIKNGIGSGVWKNPKLQIP
jgi:hypothetical protein